MIVKRGLWGRTSGKRGKEEGIENEYDQRPF
jgi:hypothetical protein